MIVLSINQSLSRTNLVQCCWEILSQFEIQYRPIYRQLIAEDDCYYGSTE